MLALASASPRRRALLAALGVEFEVVPSAVEEQPAAGEGVAEYVLRIARAKAAAVHARSGAWALGADTEVELDGVIFGKPASADDARRAIDALSARTHRVWTAVVLCGPARVDARLVVTRVRFGAIAPVERDAYLATDEWRDKAGAYAIQGWAARWLEALEGSHSAVIGLPLAETRALLAAAGLLPESAVAAIGER